MLSGTGFWIYLGHDDYTNENVVHESWRESFYM
jgi:hypothetical protein